MANRATSVVTGTSTRFSYLHVLEPRKGADGMPDKYSVCLLIPKSDTATVNAIKAAIEAAKVEAAPKFGGKVPTSLKSPVHDGDGEMPNGGEYGPECKGHWVLNASSKQAPGVVDKYVNPIIDSTQIYSGCYGRADVNFFAYKAQGNQGIACGLNNIQKIRDGEPLGGKTRASDVFTAVEDEDDGLGL